MFCVLETTKPKTLRGWIAVKLVRLAQKIQPDSDAVKAFYMQLIPDQAISGGSIVRIAPEEVKPEVRN